jgi:hypothetical protein
VEISFAREKQDQPLDTVLLSGISGGEAAANSSPKRLKMNRFKPPSILLQIHACCQEKLQLDEKQASRRPIGQAFIPTTNTFDSADV